MPNWTESDYVKRAGDIAQQHVVSKKSINDLASKVAQEEALNPEEIRTLVRLSNVAVFQELFKAQDTAKAPDRMVEFETGDPEAVVRRLVEEAQMPAQTANIHNDKLAGEVPDMMADVRRGFKLETPAAEKVAHEDVPERPMRRDMAILALRKLASEFEVERYAAGHRWEDKLAALTRTFRRLNGPDFSAFEKDAFASFGEDVRPELEALVHDTRLKFALTGPEKVAHLMDRHVVEDSTELTLLKEALEARREYVRFDNALKWVERNLR